MGDDSPDFSTPAPKKPAKRKAISKKTRFEVFKRDSFKCQYCGKCAPDVILNVDHINPVSKGGVNDLLNYITACQDCNAGKSDRLLSDDSVMAKQRAQLEELNERREQLEQMLAWREGMGNIDGIAFDAAKTAWHAAVPGWGLNEKGEADLRKYIKTFGLSEVLDAIEKSRGYLVKDEAGKLDSESVSTAFRKVGGIARMAAQPDWKREIYYIRGIIRNRHSYINEPDCLRQMVEAYESGIDTETLKTIALSTRNWREWQDEMLSLPGRR